MLYRDALAYLDTFTNYERTHQAEAMRAVRPERMLRLCERLGHPQHRFRSILVAGTNGKGSICAMTYAILRAANLRVGLYTSPHVEDLRERIRVSDRGGTILAAEEVSAAAGLPTPASDWIGQREFATLVKRVQPVVEALRREFPDDPLTYFEVLTALAWLQFVQHGVEVAVLEVGLGGRLDATNVVDPAVTVIGPIGLDHTDVLGTELAAIAREKAGIIKSGVTLTAPQAPEVLALLRETAAARGGRLLECGRDFSAQVTAHTPHGLVLTLHGVRGRYEGTQVSLLGRHQADNAALAVAAVESLSETGVPYSAVQVGLSQVQWPGRLEVVHDAPFTVLDGAHNPPAAQALRTALEELWPGRRMHLLIGMSNDKDIQAAARILGPVAASVICATSGHPRACAPERLQEQFAPYTQVTAIADPIDALMYLFNVIDPQDVVVVTGSLFLVGAVRAALRRAQPQMRKIKARRLKQTIEESKEA